MSAGYGELDMMLSLISGLSYACCASWFLTKHLQGKPSERGVFAGLLFCVNAAMGFVLKGKYVPYIFYITCSHIVFVGLTMAVFRKREGTEENKKECKKGSKRSSKQGSKRGSKQGSKEKIKEESKAEKTEDIGKEKKLFAAILVIAMTELFWNFSESFFSCIGLVMVHLLLGSRQVDVIGIWGSRWIMLMTYLTGIAAIGRLAKPFAPVFAGKRKSWYLYLMAPLLCIIIVTDLVNWAASHGIMVQSWGKFGLYENQLFSHSAMCIFTGLAMASAGFFVFGMERIEREEQTREQYQAQVMYYGMMEEQYSQMERLRHDMKNHVIALEHLIQNKQWEKAVDYLGAMAGIGGVESGDEVTGSLVLDALLYHKRRQAKERGIRWQCDAKLPENCPVKDMDLCIIVGNILDNALEACFKLQEEEKGDKSKKPEWEKENTVGEQFIQVFLGCIKKCLFLEVKNSTDLPDGWKISGRRKENSAGHGLGLLNIQAATSHYHGTVHMEVEGSIFTISVLLPLYQKE